MSKQKNTIQTYVLGELFVGAGGLALGAHNAEYKGNKFKHIWVNDLNKDARDTFLHNLKFPECTFHHCEVKELKIKKLEPIDGLIFGFPCNDFSIIGEHKGIKGPDGDMYKYAVQTLQQMKSSILFS